MSKRRVVFLLALSATVLTALLAISIYAFERSENPP